MKILLVHNAYQQSGGEDAVYRNEATLLRDAGHEVVEYTRHNDELYSVGWLGAALAGVNTVWSSTSHRALENLLVGEKPDVAHFHNTFPLISPSAYYACASAGVPVVQTLHNYRLLCPAATFFRDGHVCQSCSGRSVPWPGILHACYRDRRAATAAVSCMLTLHGALHTWKKKVNVYITLSEFARQKFIQGGLPEECIVVKPNFVAPDPGLKQGLGEYALYVGRLSEEKGLRVLLDAWERLCQPIPLKIAGDGPLREELCRVTGQKGLHSIEFLGRLSPGEVTPLMHGARFLVLPSICFENFPLAIAEAFACGLPVIASRLGALAEIVADGSTGLHFSPGDAGELAAKVQWAWAHAENLEPMGRAARREFQERYQASSNYKRLMQIYELAMVPPMSVAARVAAVQ
jgi:glycosyltransferase involved in cell wall biosynthesis